MDTPNEENQFDNTDTPNEENQFENADTSNEENGFVNMDESYDENRYVKVEIPDDDENELDESNEANQFFNMDTSNEENQFLMDAYNEQNEFYTMDSTPNNQNRFACEVCGSTFPFMSVLKRHMRSHSGEKPFPCEECGASFSRASSLKTHMVTHTGEKSFCCEVCGSAFALKGTLKRHMQRHVRTEPFYRKRGPKGKHNKHRSMVYGNVYPPMGTASGIPIDIGDAAEKRTTIREKQTRILAVPNYQHTVTCNLASLWKTGRLCDAIISNGTINLKVHKVMLGAVCPNLLDVFDNTPQDRLPKVTLPSSVSKEALLAFADYMYSGVLDLDPVILFEMKTISQRLFMNDLEQICNKQLKPFLSQDMLPTNKEPQSSLGRGDYTPVVEMVPISSKAQQKDILGDDSFDYTSIKDGKSDVPHSDLPSEEAKEETMVNEPCSSSSLIQQSTVEKDQMTIKEHSDDSSNSQSIEDDDSNVTRSNLPLVEVKAETTVDSTQNDPCSSSGLKQQSSFGRDETSVKETIPFSSRTQHKEMHREPQSSFQRDQPPAMEMIPTSNRTQQEDIHREPQRSFERYQHPTMEMIPTSSGMQHEDIHHRESQSSFGRNQSPVMEMIPTSNRMQHEDIHREQRSSFGRHQNPAMDMIPISSRMQPKDIYREPQRSFERDQPPVMGMIPISSGTRPEDIHRIDSLNYMPLTQNKNNVPPSNVPLLKAKAEATIQPMLNEPYTIPIADNNSKIPLVEVETKSDDNLAKNINNNFTSSYRNDRAYEMDVNTGQQFAKLENVNLMRDERYYRDSLSSGMNYFPSNNIATNNFPNFSYSHLRSLNEPLDPRDPFYMNPHTAHLTNVRQDTQQIKKGYGIG